MLFLNMLLTMKIIEPTINNPYKIPIDEPICLRVACTAGINRSATVREYIKNNIHNQSKIYPQYGAEYGDYDNDKIIMYSMINNDGFCEMFGKDKCDNIQMEIATELGYPLIEKNTHMIIKQGDKENYKTKLIESFWVTNNNNKNIFIIVNENQNVIDLVAKRLEESKEMVDLVICKIPDIIYYPRDKKITSQSLKAYETFIDIVKTLITFV